MTPYNDAVERRERAKCDKTCGTTTPFKAAAVDLDGTLLDSDKRISERALQTLRRIAELGAHVLIVTGRNLPAARRAMSAYDGPFALIAHNGAATADGRSGRMLSSVPLPKGSAAPILRQLRAWGRQPFLYGVSSGRVELRGSGEPSNLALRRYLDANRRVCAFSEEPPDQETDWTPLQAVAIEPAERVQAALRRGLSLPNARLITSGPLYDGSHWFLEALHADASKTAAVERFGNANGFSLNETAAVGDNWNDLELLQKCGGSAAMGNAPIDVKRAAGWIAPSNDDDGAAEALERLFNLT